MDDDCFGIYVRGREEVKEGGGKRRKGWGRRGGRDEGEEEDITEE